MSFFSKNLYSKCPSCKSHCIPIIKLGYKRTAILTCKVCGEKYYVDPLVHLAMCIVLPLAFYFLYKKISECIPLLNSIDWISYLILLFTYLVLNYFLPLRRYEE